MSSITDNNINEMLERRQTRSGTPLGGRSSVEKTGSNQKRSSLRQRTRAQTGNEVSTITEVVETQTTEVVFTENSVTADVVDIRSLRGRQKKSASVERTKNAEVAKTAVITTVTNKEPEQLYKATRRLFDQKEELNESDEEEFLADSTTRESQVFDYGSYSSDDGSGKPLRAYDIYKRAGEYWNVFPKTDFTYSPTSQDRREIAPGVINIPNMSRRGIHREGDHGRLRSPTRYRSIRTVTTSSSQWSNNTSTPKNIPASKLKFWSSLDSDEDEVDSELRHRRTYLQRSSRLTTVKNFFAHYITTIWTVITTFYAGALSKVSHAFGSRSHSAAVHSRHIATVSERNGVYSRLVYLFSKIWDISSRIFITDVWLATLWNVRGDKEAGESSSAVAGGRNNRRLLWLLLIPFLILAGLGLVSNFENLSVRENENVWETVTVATENWIQGSNIIPTFKNMILTKQELQGALTSEVERLWARLDQLSASFEELRRKKQEPHFQVDPNGRLFRHKIQDLSSRIRLLQEQQAYLNRQLTSCCKDPPAFPAAQVEEHVTNILMGLHGSTSPSTELESLRAQLDQLSANFEDLERRKPEPHVLVDPSSRLWRNKIQDMSSRLKLLQEQQAYLLKHFVAKDELELRLTNVTADVSSMVNKNVIKASKTSLNLIMNTAEQIKQELVRQKEEMELNRKGGNEWEDSGSTVVGGVGLSHEQVQRIVDSALAKYDADKTGLVDYALESSGGSILSTRCTENYQPKTARFSMFGLLHWYASGASPRTVIQPGVNPGNCWAFAGSQGFLVIKLSGWVQLSAFSLEHIPRSLSPTGRIDSAPKDFQVFGLRDEQDERPLEIGKFRYQDNGTSLQYFKVQRTDLPPFNIVELRVESNHGNMDYTCLYRFRVHGVRVSPKGSDK